MVAGSRATGRANAIAIPMRSATAIRISGTAIAGAKNAVATDGAKDVVIGLKMAAMPRSQLHRLPLRKPSLRPAKAIDAVGGAGPKEAPRKWVMAIGAPARFRRLSRRRHPPRLRSRKRHGRAATMDAICAMPRTRRRKTKKRAVAPGVRCDRQ